MVAKIHLPPPWQKFINNAETVEVNGSTVGECLQNMFQKFPDLQKTVPPTGFEIYINSERVFSWQSDQPVKDGDEMILSSISGCC